MKVKSCRFCLAVKAKFFKLGKTGARLFIENIFMQNGFKQGLRESHNICHECKALLEKSYHFIQRLLKAQGILVNLLTEHKKVTLASLNEIDRQKTGISTCLTTHVLKNIDIFATDDNGKSIIKNAYNDLKVEVDSKNEIDLDTIDLSSSNDELETIDDSAKQECEDQSHDETLPVSVKKKVNNDENDATFSIKQYLKDKRKSAIDVETSNAVEKTPVTEKRSRKLEPSKFILSLSNVGDKSERRMSKRYVFEEKDDDSESELSQAIRTEYDEEFAPDDSFGESSDSSYDRYGDSCKGTKRPDKRGYPLECDECEYEVPSGKEHYKHYIYVHPDKPYPYAYQGPTYVCQFCGKISKKKSLHKSHELTHGKEKKYNCWQCPKRFINSLRLFSHMRNAHPKIFLECDYCAKKFKTRIDIIRHFRTHTGEKPFKCHICKAAFAHKGNVRLHIRSNHEELDKRKKKSKSTKRKRERKYSSDDSLLNLLHLKTKINKGQDKA